MNAQVSFLVSVTPPRKSIDLLAYQLQQKLGVTFQRITLILTFYL
jgi:hypothetical protein